MIKLQSIGILVFMIIFNLSSASDFCDLVDSLKGVYAEDKKQLIDKIRFYIEDEHFCPGDKCLGKALQVIGNAYADISDYGAALAWTYRAIHFRRIIVDTVGLIRSYYRLHLLYNLTKQYAKSQNVLDILIRHFSNHELGRIAFIVKGDDQFNLMRDFTLAEKYYREFEAFCKNTKDTLYELYARFLIMRIDRELGRGNPEDHIAFIEKYLQYLDAEGILTDSFDKRLWQPDHKFQFIMESYKTLFYYYNTTQRHADLLRKMTALYSTFGPYITEDDDRQFLFYKANAEIALGRSKLAVNTLKQMEKKLENPSAASELVDLSHCFSQLYALHLSLSNLPLAEQYLRKNSKLLFGPQYADCLHAFPNFNELQSHPFIHNTIYQFSNLADYFCALYRADCSDFHLQAAVQLYDLCDSLISYFQELQVLEDSRIYLRESYYSLYAKAFTASLAMSDYGRAFEFSEKAKSQLIISEISNKDWLVSLPMDIRQKLQQLTSLIWDLQYTADREYVSDSIRQKRLKAIDEYLALKKLLSQKYPKIGKFNFQVDLKAFQQTLQDHMCALSYFQADSLLYCILVTNRSVDVTQKSWSKTENDSIDAFCRMLADHTLQDMRVLKERASVIAQKVFPSVEIQRQSHGQKGLHGYTHLVIIPSKELNMLPFECLVADEFLVTKYSFEYQWSASLRTLLLQRKYDCGRLSAFAPGFTDGRQNLSYRRQRTSQQAASLEPLPFSLEEVRQIHKIWGGRLFTNSKATKAQFLRCFDGRSSVLHLATHSVTDPHSVDSSYVAFFDQGNDSNSKMYVAELKKHYVGAQLVVLSACETAKGKKTNSEGNIGFARNITSCGVGAVVSTLWKVNDASSSLLMKYFYVHLKNGSDKAVALRRAKLDLMSNHPELRSPYYWAPYMLYGNHTSVKRGFFCRWLG